MIIKLWNGSGRHMILGREIVDLESAENSGRPPVRATDKYLDKNRSLSQIPVKHVRETQSQTTLGSMANRPENIPGLARLASLPCNIM